MGDNTSPATIGTCFPLSQDIGRGPPQIWGGYLAQRITTELARRIGRLGRTLGEVSDAGGDRPSTIRVALRCGEAIDSTLPARA